MPSLYAIYSRYSDNVGPSLTAEIETGVSTNDPDYAPASLFDGNPAKPAKIDSTTAAWLVYASGSPITKTRIDYAALIHHDFVAGGNVRIQGNDTNSWGSPTLNVAFTISPWKGSGTTVYPVNAGVDLTGESGYTTAGFNYWRLVITGNNQNVQLGELVLLSQIRRLDPHIQWEYVKQYEKRLIDNRTEFGVSTIYSRMVTERRLVGTLRADDALNVDLEDHWYDVDGRALPWLFVPFFPAQSSTDIESPNEPLFVRFADPRRSVTHFSFDIRDQRWELEEIARGMRLGV